MIYFFTLGISLSPPNLNISPPLEYPSDNLILCTRAMRVAFKTLPQGVKSFPVWNMSWNQIACFIVPSPFLGIRLPFDSNISRV